MAQKSVAKKKQKSSDVKLKRVVALGLCSPLGARVKALEEWAFVIGDVLDRLLEDPRKYGLALLLLMSLSVACANPVGPSESPGVHPPVNMPPLVQSGSTTTPPLQPPGPWWTITPMAPDVAGEPHVLRWKFEVEHGLPHQRFHVIAVSHHHDQTEGGPTTDRLGSMFRIDGQVDYPANQGGTTVFRYDTRDRRCGRVQLDASVIYDDGTEQLIIGEMHRTGRDCLPPPNPDCLKSIGQRSVSGGTATFEIQPGGLVQISFVSYRLGATFLPQTFVAGESGWFGPGVHTLTLPIVHPFQSDLYCGGFKPEDLTEENHASDYGPRVIAYDHSGR